MLGPPPGLLPSITLPRMAWQAVLSSRTVREKKANLYNFKRENWQKVWLFVYQVFKNEEVAWIRQWIDAGQIGGRSQKSPDSHEWKIRVILLKAQKSTAGKPRT